MATGPRTRRSRTFSPCAVLYPPRRPTNQAAALQSPLLHQAVPAIIPGGMAPGQVTENVARLGEPVPQDCWNELKTEGLLRRDAPTGQGRPN